MSATVIHQGLLILGGLAAIWALLTCRNETRLYTFGLLVTGTTVMFVGSRLGYGLGDWLTILTGLAALACAAGWFRELRTAWRRTGGAR